MFPSPRHRLDLDVVTPPWLNGFVALTLACTKADMAAADIEDEGSHEN